ncbi:MAG: hypothetical protein HQ514_17995 [Rhodospirillales bacterium]|nr:hypothetical protein [Rhodospirillales bacterium]
MVEPPDPADPTLTGAQKHAFKLLEAARRALAPDMTPEEYYDAIWHFENNQMGRIENQSYPNRIISAEDAAQMPDNSAKYETVAYRYHGLDRVRELLDDGRPVAFVGWHHGARGHGDYALARTIPRIAIFSRWIVQYGTVFSIPMATTGGLALVKMKRFLEDGRPVFYYLDGEPGGDCVNLPVFGINCNFSTAPIKLFQSVAGLRIVPVTNFYVDGTEDDLAVEVNFHPALGVDGELAGMDERGILASLLAPLEQDQREQGPGQVLINYFSHRERLARQAGARQASDRQKTT